ncbi:MAG: PQQ-binding-like beta-propeller repeat protein [Bacteroidia bacterium]|nr:PQQ-binding-like beta-propeller repeat protein [Bacteroidia bacterium]
MKNHLIAMLIAVSALACGREQIRPRTNDAGEIVSLPAIWKLPLHADGVFHSNSIPRAHLVWDHKALIATTGGPDDRALTCVDTRTGEVLWQWSDIYNPPTEYFDIFDTYIYEGVMTYTVGGRHYAIDMETGATKWRFQRDRSYHKTISGIGHRYFINGPPTDTLAGYDLRVLHEGDLRTGTLRQILFPVYSQQYVGPGNRIGDVTGCVSVIQGADTLLAVIYQEPRETYNWISFLGLYSLTRRVWVYERVQINDEAMNGVLFHEPVISGNQVYMNIGSEIACHDLGTGEQCWKRDFPRDFQFSGFIVEEGLLIANCEDKVLYGLAAATGATRWTGEGAGTSSLLEGRSLNGVVYFSGGSSSRIHAVDLQTGKTLWRLDPALIEPGAEDWKPDLYVIPGEGGKKGRVIACTPMHAYAFEAER